MSDDELDDETEDDVPEVVEIPLEERIDLHGFLPRDVPQIVRDYLDDAFAAGFTEVRLIHGRGIAVLRETVRTLLSRDARVATFRDARPEEGGQGATVAVFKR